MAAAAGEGDEQPRSLEAGQAVDVAVAGGDAFRMRVPSREAVVVEVRNRGIDTYGKLLAGNGATVARSATWRGREGRYRLYLSNAAHGPEVEFLEISAVEGHVRDGQVSIEALPLEAFGAEAEAVAGAVSAFEHGADRHLGYYFGEGDSRKAAVEAFKAGLYALEHAERAVLKGDGHYELAAAYKSLDRLSLARDEYKAAARHYREAGDTKGVAATASLLGLLAWRQGDGENAIAHLEQAVELRRGTGQELFLAEALNNLGLVFRDEGEFRDSLNYLGRALDIFEGEADIRQHDPDGPAESLLQRVKSGGSLHSALNTLNNLALVHDSIGDVQRAERYWRVFLALGDSLANPLKLAQAKHNLGATLHDLGQLDRALALLDESLAEFERLGSNRWRVLALMSIGEVYAGLGRYDAAQAHLEQARRAAQGNRKLTGAVLYELGEAKLVNDEAGGAESLLREALRMHQGLQMPVQAARIKSDLAAALLRQGDAQRALEIQVAAVDRLRESGAIRSLGEGLSRLGKTRLALGERSAARDDLQQALQAHGKAGDALGEVETLRLLAQSFVESDSGRALAFARRATGKALKLRPAAVGPSLRASFLAKRRDAFDLHVEILMGMGRKDAAWRVAEMMRARALHDLVARRGVKGADSGEDGDEATRDDLIGRLSALTSKLEDVSRRGERHVLIERVQRARRRLDLLEADTDPDDAARYRAQADDEHGLARFQALLGDDAVGLAFFLTRTHGYLWVVSSDGVTTHEVPGRQTLTRQVETLLGDLRQPRSSPGRIGRRADALSANLLGSVAKELDANTIVVIPDGPLHSLPFGLLGRREPGSARQQPLIEAHEVVTVPSAALLGELRLRESTPAEGIFVLADPAFGRSLGKDGGATPFAAVLDGPAGRRRGGGEQHVLRLPGTRREAEAIREYAAEGRVTASVGRGATLDAVERGLSEDHRVVHLATHGVVNHQWPRLSALLLAPSAPSRQADELRPHEISELPIKTELVVLSACDTGAGQRLAGEGVLSLTRPFFVGGARRVLSTLWKVSDRGTAALMEHFYRSLLEEGRSPAAALRVAKRNMRRDDQWSHPYFWAGFELQGDWRVGVGASQE